MQRFKLALAIAAIALVAHGPAWAGDRETAQQIADAIRESGSLNDYAIGVKFQDGTVWLKGNVRDGRQMARAVEIAERSPEVTSVINQLEVPTPAQTAWQGEATRSRPASRSMSFSEKISKILIGEKSPAAKSTSRQIGSRGHMTSSRRRSAGAPTLAGAAQPMMPMPVQYDGQQVANIEPIETPVDAPEIEMTANSARSGAARVPSRSVAPASATRSAPRGMPGVYHPAARQMNAAPLPTYVPGPGPSVAPVAYDHPHMPNYAWPSYAAHPNYAGLTYPRQYSPTAWPYIGPFYPYPQVPLGWRKVTLEWDDGWWFLDFDDKNQQHDGCWWW